jgi:hypothetical protein
MQGIVKERAQTESGARYIKIDNQRYYFDRNVNEFPEVGAKIDFEWHEFGEAKGKYGKPRSISAWKPVVNAAGKPETGSTISDADILRSVSNVVGSACAAGTIKDPVELEKWFVAAWAGFTRRAKSATGKDPELDDDLPEGFYRSENPAPNGAEPGW